MPVFSDPMVTPATMDDAAGITRLLNNAYRGESSRGGWTTEADLIAGDTRTTISQVEDLIHQPGSVFLLLKEGTDLLGCVNLQVHGHRVYFGMFSVQPGEQGRGLGKKLLLAAEEYARQKGCKAIYMSVITRRTELINWYIRHGYQDTGERKPFQEDGISGKHLLPLEFMTLEKAIG